MLLQSIQGPAQFSDEQPSEGELNPTSLLDQRAAAMTRRKYKNPPVHEVHLDVRFSGVIPPAELVDIPKALGDEFGVSRHAQTLTIVSSGGQVSSDAQFSGWEFSETEPRWVLRTQSGQLTVIMARSQAWPSGEYVGWEAVYERFVRVCERVQPFYGHLRPRRVGVRYVNRIAVPDGTSLGDWLNLAPQTPDLLSGLYTFDIQAVWREIREHPSMSATVRTAKISIPPSAEVSSELFGVLLDIEVFNLLVENAPQTLAEVPHWVREAHEVENAVFEGVITKKLRATFD